MFVHFVAFFLFLSPGARLTTGVDDVTDGLAQAEALYYAADFGKSVDVLLRVDDALRSQPNRVQEKITTKVQLALAYIGLNDNAKAKVAFQDLYSLDPEYALDAQQYSPKVIALADQAKVEKNQDRCRTARTDAERFLVSGNGDAVFTLFKSMGSKCPALADIAANVSSLVFKQGLDAYKKGQVSDALVKFRQAAELHPGDELAAGYVELAQNKLQVDSDRALMGWRKSFEAREYGSATDNYRQLALLAKNDTMNQIRGEYRTALTKLIDAMNRACTSNDMPTVEKLRAEISQVLPDRSIGEDILAGMKPCNSCIQMTTSIALARLKSRVDPDFPPAVRDQIKAPVTVRAKLRIGANGAVVNSDLQGGNPIVYPAVRSALERWTFQSAVVQGEARCIDTEIPIVITKQN